MFMINYTQRYVIHVVQARARRRTLKFRTDKNEYSITGHRRWKRERRPRNLRSGAPGEEARGYLHLGQVVHAGLEDGLVQVRPSGAGGFGLLRNALVAQKVDEETVEEVVLFLQALDDRIGRLGTGYVVRAWVAAWRRSQQRESRKTIQ
jgi:hypothetical protein